MTYPPLSPLSSSRGLVAEEGFSSASEDALVCGVEPRSRVGGAWTRRSRLGTDGDGVTTWQGGAINFTVTRGRLGNDEGQETQARPQVFGPGSPNPTLGAGTS